MTRTAEYWLARYTPDLFRQEPRNVGVLVHLDGVLDARFLGEREPGKIDGRSIRYTFADTAAYEAWVQFWRRTLEQAPQATEVRGGPHDLVSYLVEASRGQYSVTPGGELAGVADRDRPADVRDFLYRSLVGDEGFATVMAGEAPTMEPRTALRTAVQTELVRGDLLGSVDEPLLSRGKVIPNLPVKGTANEPHRPDFVQENGRLWVMAVVDFTTPQTRLAKEHAGTAAYIFRDLREAKRRKVEPISLVRRGGDDPDVRWGQEVLESNSSVIDWDDPVAQRHFLQDRARAAHGA